MIKGRYTKLQQRKSRSSLRPTGFLEIAVSMKASWGEVPAGTLINPLRVERMFSSPDFMAYGGPLYKPLPDMTTFDAYIECINPADRERVAALMSQSV